MDESRQIAAVVALLANVVMCYVWWFALSRFPKNRILLALLIFRAVALVFDVLNIYVAFGGRSLIGFESPRDTISFFTALSYLGTAWRIAEILCYVLLVRWIVRDFAHKTP
jgi:hypothetical protein